MDIVEQVEAGQAVARSSTSTEASEGSGRASPLFSHAGLLVKEEAPSHQDASTPDSRGSSHSPREPLASPGP